MQGMRDLIRRVAEFVVKRASLEEELVPFGEDGRIVEPIFAPIRDEGPELEIAYVDGGSALLLEMPNSFITLNKVVAVVYRGSNYLRMDGPHTFISVLAFDGKGAFTKIFGAEGLMPEEMEHHSHYWEVLQFVPRRVAERRLAALMLESADAVVIDGTLGFQRERNEVIATEELLAKAKDGALAGLAKSTKVLYKGMPITAFVNSKFKASYELRGQGHFIAYVGNLKRLPMYESKLYVVKLSSAARKAFLLEVANGNVDELAYNLAMASADPSVPGYPYPLVVADRMSKVHLRDELPYVKNELIDAIDSIGGREHLEEALFHEILNELNL